MVTWLAGNRIRGTTAERVGASPTQATPTKIIDGSYTVLTYTANGKFIPKGSFNVDVLTVGGGGSGGTRRHGAGGGAGGYIETTSQSVTARNYTITVGAGGASTQSTSNASGSDGTYTAFDDGGAGEIKALGGGAGGGYSDAGSGGSGTYGSGGGSGGSITSGNPAGTSGQGNSGGYGTGSNGNGGGGGGSSSAGTNGSLSSGVGSDGGSGTNNNWTGSTIGYAGGGAGGHANNTGGSGTATHGAHAGAYPNNIADANSGAGGSAGDSMTENSEVYSGDGGSGIVIIRFLTSGNTYDVEDIGLMPSLTSGVGGWHEVGRTTLESDSNTITVSSIPNKRYYKLVYHINGVTGTANNFNIRLGSSTIDTGSNYAFRYAIDGVRSSSINQTVWKPNFNISSTGDHEAFTVGYISNLSSKEKLSQFHTVSDDGHGSNSDPHRYEMAGKWTNTSNIIDIIQVKHQTTASQFTSGSEVVVLGWDPADTHTTNFWEELASVELGSASDNLSTGTFTAKKYLWFQVFINSASSSRIKFQFNGDTANNYAFRYSGNGATPDASTGASPQGSLNASYNYANYNKFFNGFIINNSANEKFLTGINMEAPAGAGSAPNRVEFVGKWANTSAQITEIDVLSSATNAYGVGSIIKVWGSN
jgi:hypothetical protein